MQDFCIDGFVDLLSSLSCYPVASSDEGVRPSRANCNLIYPVATFPLHSHNAGPPICKMEEVKLDLMFKLKVGTTIISLQPQLQLNKTRKLTSSRLPSASTPI